VSKSLVEARQEVSRQQILEVAKRLFAEQGVRATSLARIAEELGITKAALYHYFDAKQEIVVEAVLANVRDFSADVMAPLPEGLSAAETLVARMERRVARAVRDGPLDLRFFYTVMLEELDEPVVEQVYRDFWDWGRREALEILRRGQQAGEVRTEADPDALVTVMTATSMGIDLLWLNDPDRVDYAAAHRLAIDNLLHSLAP
jgi:AcrR family transcriptional regulator